LNQRYYKPEDFTGKLFRIVKIQLIVKIEHSSDRGDVAIAVMDAGALKDSLPKDTTF
jgi:hypothetical protein